MENLGLFGRLSGELRNQIYDLTLTHGPGRKASPALLRTCKQIHHEARDVLYHNSTFYLDLWIDERDIELRGDVYGNYTDHLGDAFFPPIGGQTPKTPPKYHRPETLFPAWAWRVRRLEIKACTEEVAHPINYFLLVLFHFLGAEKSAVQEVHFTLLQYEEQHPCHYRNWMEILYPLAKLPRDVDMVFDTEGFQSAVRRDILQLRSQDDLGVIRRLKFDPFKELQALQDDIDDILGIELQYEYSERIWAGYLYDVGYELLYLIAEDMLIDDCRIFTIYYPDGERNVMVYLDVLREVLQVLKTDPDEDEQHRYLLYPSRVQELGFTVGWLDRMRDPKFPPMDAFDAPWRSHRHARGERQPLLQEEHQITGG